MAQHSHFAAHVLSTTTILTGAPCGWLPLFLIKHRLNACLQNRCSASAKKIIVNKVGQHDFKQQQQQLQPAISVDLKRLQKASPGVGEVSRLLCTKW